MTDSDKKEIQKLLKDRVSEFSSQRKALMTLNDVSEATGIQVLKGNWESISDSMWRNIGKQVGFNSKGSWRFVPIVASKQLANILDDAGESGNTYAVVANAGGTKTFTSAHYAKKDTNTFHIQCSEYWNRKTMLGEILSAMGKDNLGYSVAEMMEQIVKTVMPLDEPKIVVDEFDKLSDSLKYFFISLYNRLDGNCGLVIMGTDFMQKQIEQGVRKNKKGFKEIFSRIGRKFIHLKPVTENEVADICRENGLKDQALIKNIFNEFEGDLRRVKRMVYKFKKKSENKTA